MGNKSYSKGICWIDDCRIPFVDENIDFNSTQKGKVYGRNSLNESITERNTTHYNNEGRFPANLLVCDDMLNDGVVSKSSLFPKTNTPIFDTKQGWNDNSVSGSTGGGFNDKGSNSRYYDIDKWFNNLIDE